MDILIAVVVVGGIGLWFWSRATDRRQQVTETRQGDVAIWFHSEETGDDQVSAHAVVDFRTMTGHRKARGLGWKHESEYLIRRMDGPRWETRLTDESWAKERERLRTQIPERRTAASMIFSQVELDEMGDAPSWKPVSDAVAPSLETAYQRYVRQG